MIIHWVGEQYDGQSPTKGLVIADRDGTLTLDHGRPHRWSEISLNEHVLNTLTDFQQSGWSLAVVTNQSAVARGMTSLDEVFQFNEVLADRLRARGLVVDIFVICPHAPGDEGEPACTCRKPQPTMIVACLKMVVPERAVVVGDKASDMEAAARAGIPGVRVDSADFSTQLLSHLDDGRDRR